MMPKARLAPTPSGYLHRGNAANFLLNARLAEGGELLLRIDDLDRDRFRPEYLEDIFRVIDRLGITVTEGPTGPDDFAANWSQEHRMPLYQEALAKLRSNEWVFACPCTRKELAGGLHKYGCLDRKVSLDAVGAAWRVDTRSFDYRFIRQYFSRDGFNLKPADVIPDFVIRKKNGRPSYQLACVVDDAHFNIDIVGRGEDLLPSTIAQDILSDLIGYPPMTERIIFIHHPLLLGPEGRKLSKRAGAQEKPLTQGTLEVEALNQLVSGWLSSGPV